MKKKRPFPCPYCREKIAHKGSTRDHVPPQCLFGDGLRQNLITVRCCAACHQSLSAGDDLLRAVAMSAPNRTNEADLLTGEFERSLSARSPWSKDLLKGTLNARWVEAEGKQWAEVPISIESRLALHTTIKRIATGLIYKKQTRDFNPHTVDFVVHGLNPDQIPELASIFGNMKGAHQVNLGNRAFHGRWTFVENSLQLGLMVMSFFRAFNLVILMFPKGYRPPVPGS